MPRLDFYADYQPYLSLRIGEGPLLVGRSADCQVQFPGSRVSREHARIVPVDGGHEIEDLSRNGTRINAEWVTERQRLEPGDRVYVADRVFIYQPDDSPVEDLRRWSAKDETVVDD